MTTTSTPVNRTDNATAIPMPLVLKPGRIFWTAFGVNALFDAVIAVALLGFGIATGYQGRPVFDGSRLGEAVNYLFGGVVDLFAFIGVLVAVGLLLWGMFKLIEKEKKVLAILCGAAIFAIGLVTSQFLGVGTNVVPLLVFTAFVAVQSGVITVLLSGRANH